MENIENDKKTENNKEQPTQEGNKDNSTFISNAKVYRMKRMALITDIILIVVLLGIAWNTFNNWEELKQYRGDVCRLCQDKTGGVCTALPRLSDTKKTESVDYNSYFENLTQP